MPKIKNLFSVLLAFVIAFGCMAFSPQAAFANESLPRASAEELAKFEATMNELRLSIEASENEFVEDSITQSTFITPSLELRNAQNDAQAEPSSETPNALQAAAEYIEWQWTLSINKNEVNVYCDLLQGTFPLLSASATIEVRDAKGNLTASYPISASFPFYNKSWNWSKPISTTTVEETVSLVNARVYYDIGQYGDTRTLQVNRNNFKGGAYNSIAALDGERHHMFSSYVYEHTVVNRYDATGLNIVGSVSRTGTAPVILMNKADHQNTLSWGNKPGSAAHRDQQLNLVRQGYYYDACMMDYNDIKSQFGTKYDNALYEWFNYWFWTLNWVI